MSSIDNPSPPGGGGGGSTPTLIPESTTYNVPTETQLVVALPIYVDGTLLIDGSVQVL